MWIATVIAVIKILSEFKKQMPDVARKVLPAAFISEWNPEKLFFFGRERRPEPFFFFFTKKARCILASNQRLSRMRRNLICLVILTFSLFGALAIITIILLLRAKLS